MARTWANLITFIVLRPLAILGLFGALLAPGISVAGYQPPSATYEFAIGGQAGWVDTGIDVRRGETLTFTATGTARIGCRDRWGQGRDFDVGPEGTFLINDGIGLQPFVMASGEHGPAPCFCVIARIGQSDPFFVGRATSRACECEGRLQLAINTFPGATCHADFCVLVTRDETVAPLWVEQVVEHSRGGRYTTGRSVPDCATRVVVFYVDGLRPDVVREMVAMGHLPTIRHLFIDNGTWLKNTFTAFPSDTITSNGTMWTGCFSDRHGLKAQVRFTRRGQYSESYLEPLGPDRSSQLLSPQGLDRWLNVSAQQVRAVVDGEQDAERWRRRTVTDVPPIYQFLRQSGSDWATGVLPIMTEVPPALWTRSMTRQLPWFDSHNAWQYIDDANATYGVRHLLHRDSPVTILWFPETDSVSHKCNRGQFGSTRRTIARVDQLISQVVDELQATGRLESTCFMLVSDHGHHGGRTMHLRHFDIANDLLFRPRHVDQEGHWMGGGLGLSVRMHRSWNRHPEQHQREYVFVDGDTDGAARLFFPKGCFTSRDWSGPNSPGDLLQYHIAPHLPPIDLVATLADARSCTGERAVDLVLMKLNATTLLISTADRGHAVIDRQCDNTGQWVYRYRPVSRIWSDGRGGVLFSVAENPTHDPLLLAQRLAPVAMQNYYDEQTWLELTAQSLYPDSVVALSRHLLWQESLAEYELEFAPDLVVTARPGWYFGTASTPGTNHGYPLYDSMHATWFVSGPGVRRGVVVESPARLVDLTPTILDVIQCRTEPGSFEGVVRHQIYATADDERLAVRPVQWRDIDLGGWQPLSYQPLPESEHKPASVNHSESRWDLSNTIYNVAAIADTSVFRILDDVVSPLAASRPGPVASRVEHIEARGRHADRPELVEGTRVLNPSELAVTDYNLTSQGNLHRVSKAVDWVQGRSQDLDRRIAQQAGKPQTKPGTYVNRAVDGTQAGFWEAYRFGQRLVIQVVDETLVNGLENTADRTLNGWRQMPAEVLVR